MRLVADRMRVVAPPVSERERGGVPRETDGAVAFCRQGSAIYPSD